MFSNFNIYFIYIYINYKNECKINKFKKRNYKKDDS